MWWKLTYRYSKLCDINTHEKKLIHCMAVYIILYGNYYPPHGQFELICIGKFARWTWVNFTQQYGKNRQRCQQNKLTMLHGNYCYIFIEDFPKKFSPCSLKWEPPEIKGEVLSSGRIISRTRTCKAGLGGKYQHVLGTLLYFYRLVSILLIFLHLISYSVSN